MVIKKTQQAAEEKTRDLERTQPGSWLKDRVAVVTGSDSGIGQATAIAFARQGAKVAVTVHEDEEGATRTREEVEKAGGEAVLVDLDQTNRESVRRMFEKVRAEFGTPTILVNNAGIDSTGKNVVDMDPEDWQKEMDTNLNGPFYVAQEFLKGLRDAGMLEKDESPPEEPTEWTRAVMINVTSVHQSIPRPGSAGYDVAKGGLRNLTRTLALELAEARVRVVNVAPGMVLTPFNQPAIDDPEKREKQVQSIPVKRAAQPDEIARVITFLASDEASYIHGTTIFVDGGLMMNLGQGA